MKTTDPEKYLLDGMTISRRDITFHVDIWKSRSERISQEIESLELRHETAVSELIKERDSMLQKGGFEPGTCEIHGVRLTWGKVDITYGFPSAELLDETYPEAHKGFRNADAPYAAGEPESGIMLDSMRRLVCHGCSKARHDWLKK